MIICCKCGGDCGPGVGVSMCFGCNEMADMEFEARSCNKQVSMTQEELIKLVQDARLALLANGVFHTPLALRQSGQTEWNEYQIDAIHRTKKFLASTENFWKELK